MLRAACAERPAVLAVALVALAACLLLPQSSPAAVTQVGGPGVGTGTFNVPGPDAVDASGNLYVLDANRGTLQKFSNTGSFIASINSANSLPLPTHDVGGVAIDPSSNGVFVADPDNARLIELNSSLVY